MSNNQELVSFPFRPYLAKYLFHIAKNEVIETEQALYRNLDLNMKSPDARFIRILMERKDVPGLQTLPPTGFRLTVRVPKHSAEFNDVVEDSRTKAIWIDEETAKLIHDHFDARFRDHFLAFVHGAVHGSTKKRKTIKRAILTFMGVYGLHEDDVTYNYDQLNKLYERRNSPLKGNIYAKKEEDNAKKSETSL
jgi:hypothetical protein